MGPEAMMKYINPEEAIKRLAAAQGIDVAIAVADINAIGEVVACNGSYVAGVTTVGSANAYVSLDYDTAAFTAGAAKLVIEYIG